jgi:NAD/NADP transhydrogenase alpha subunit
MWQALMEQLEAQGATVMAMDCIPRMLSRGQAFDALTSQVRSALGGWVCVGQAGIAT